MNSKRGSAAILFILPAVALHAASPLSPAEEQRSFQLADTNLVVELVAAEPDVRAPVAVAWDAEGRMLVAEMTDYPSGPVNGRIRLLEDRDGDGRYEHASLFATNLAFPNGVMAWKNGVLVTAAPDVWFLADTNGDGRADLREKILTGFVEGNQQLRVNGLYWGLDNWIYGCNGRSDGEVKWADGTPAGSIRRHDFRFRPDTKEFEVIAGNSQFGMGHDDWGNRFPVFNATPIRHVVIEDPYLGRQPLLTGTDNVPSISPTNDGNRVFALTPPTLLIPQPVGFFTSACGPSIFRGTALPGAYRGNFFVCEPVQNVVQRRVLRSNGSTFVAEYAHTNEEFLASTDRWFHGVFTATGPDGAFYIVDFYRDLVEHPHWVAPEIRDHVDWRKGEEHGRIWRVRAKDAKLTSVEKLSRASNSALVQALENANGWTRDTAQRLLVERRATNEVRSLERMVRTGATDQTRVRALNVIVELSPGEVGPLVEALEDPDGRVREHAIRIVEPVFASVKWPGSSNLLATLRKNMHARCIDADARVRLQAVCSWGNIPDDEQRLDALAEAVRHKELDEWQTTAVLAGARAQPAALLQRLRPLLGNATEQQLICLNRLVARAAPSLSEAEALEWVGWMHGAMSGNGFGLLATLVESTPATRRAPILAQAGGTNLVEPMLEVALRQTLQVRDRLAAIRLIASAGGIAEADALLALLNWDQPEPIQAALAKAFAESDNDAVTRRAFARWPWCSKAARRQMVTTALQRSSASMVLFDLIEDGAIPVMEIDPITRQSFLKSTNTRVKERAMKLFPGSISADRQAVIEKFRLSLKREGDRAHGAAVFERACVVCHQMQGVGAKVGPDLSGIGQHARETLLVEILDPSRQVLPDFVSYTATTANGDTYTGFIANESAATVTLRRPNEPDITLPRANLKEFKTNGQSLMPDGLEAGMTEQDLADLIEFLRRPDRTLFSQSK